MVRSGLSNHVAMLRAILPERARTSKRIYDACWELARHGDISALMPTLFKLSQNSAYAHDARQLLSMCKQLRRSGVLEETINATDLLAEVGSVDRNALDETEPQSVLIRKLDGAETTLIVFASHEGVFWVSISLLHHYLRHYPINILYVRDDRKRFHLAGLNGLGVDYESSLHGLARLVAALGTHRLYCMGGSAGGYAALRFGLDLGASGTIAFSAPTTLDPAQIESRNLPEIAVLLDAAPAMAADLVPLYAAAREIPTTILCHGTANLPDTRHAERLAEVEGVRRYPIEDYVLHDTLAYFAINKKFDVMFELLAGGR